MKETAKKIKSPVRSVRSMSGLAAITAAAAVTATQALAGTSSATGSGGTAVTISISGSTAMSNFTRSAGFSLLNPGSNIDLLSGPGGAPVRYKAANNFATSVQLAANNFNTGITANPSSPGVPLGADDILDPPQTSANYGALRIEWHEQGSVEGIFELADSQINDGIYANTTYNGSAATGVYVNQNKFGGTTPNTAWNPPASASVNGFTISTFANANDRTTAQIQNRVQMAISDVNAAQGFSRAGTSAFNMAPGSAGYGKGNPALAGAANTSGIGIAGSRHALLDEQQLNMTTGTIDPGTIPGDVGSGGLNYASGPWNSAGVGNLHNTQVAVTATTYAANPGTGLVRINKSDARWLQATGRLANGADFNVATRDVNSGTLNVAALNVGLDPSWAAGENDGGAGGGAAFDNIGPTINFSNKSSGGSNLRPTVQNSRMAIGHLSLSDYRGGGSNNGNRPTRALNLFNSDTDTGSAGVATVTVGGKTYVATRDGAVEVNAYNIVHANYASFQNETYVTVKDVTQGATAFSQFVTDYTAAEGAAPTDQQKADLWAGNLVNGGGGRSYVLNDNPTVKNVVGLATTYGTGIKGDNKNVIAGTDYGHDVYDVRKNIVDSVNQFPPASTASPADNLILTSFILPQFMEKEKSRDGGALFANPTYQAATSNTFLGSTSANNFDTNGTTGTAAGGLRGPGDVTLGDGSSTYGNVTPAGGQGAITIIDSGGGKGNWMFGNFRQNGVRDFAAVKAAADAQIALTASGLGTDMSAGAAGSNNTAVAGVSTALQNFHGTANAYKGDLIVMGDYNSDGKFDGKDLYLMARGAALSDASGAGFTNGQLTTATGGIANDFADWVRKGKLRKNDALDYMAGTFPGGSAQAIAASANLTNDPNGANAFNKRDVNRDGLVNFVDAITSDKFFGKNYTNFDDQLAATGDVRVGETPAPFSLVDAELNDTGTIDQTDLDVIDTSLTAAGNETWAGTLHKTGGGAVSMGYTSAVVKVNAGAALLIDAGSVSAGGSADPFTDNSGSATNGTHLAITNNSTSTFNITAGEKAIATLNGIGNTFVAFGASLTADSVRQGNLAVNGNLTIRPNGNNTSILTTLSIGGTGKLDLSDNDLIVHDTPVGTLSGSNYTGVTGFIQSGRNGGGWGGPGIVTSQSTATTSNLTTLGVATAAQVKGIAASETAVWNGQSVTGSDTLVMYTYGGDANLDGKINVDDYGHIDSSISIGLTGWYNGDFNYDGKINVDDYGIIDFNIGIQGPPLGSGAGLSEVSAVPEPGSAGLLFSVLGVPLARAMRRRRR